MMETSEDLQKILLELLNKIVSSFEVEDFKKYAEEYLLVDQRLPEWIDCQKPDFNSF